MSEATVRAAKSSDTYPATRVVATRVVADAPHIHREAVRLLSASGFVVAGPTSAAPAARRPPTGAPVLIVLLLSSGAEERLAAIAESAGQPGAFVVASMPADAGNKLLRDALRAGADGIVLDGQFADALVPTVQAVAAGQLALPPTLRRRLAPRALSYREKEILALVVRGYTNRQIADQLFVAESTVKTHLSSAFGKLDTRSRSEAAALILDPDEGYGLGVLPSFGLAPQPAA